MFISFCRHVFKPVSFYSLHLYPVCMLPYLYVSTPVTVDLRPFLSEVISTIGLSSDNSSDSLHGVLDFCSFAAVFNSPYYNVYIVTFSM